MTSANALPSMDKAKDVASSQQLKALAESITRIREPLALEAIFQNTATEARQLLQADRVAVFRFDPAKDWEGEFVSEDVAEGWKSVLAERVYDHCFGEQFAPHYQQGRLQAVADIHAADLSDCHAEILDRFQVRANLAVPVLHGKYLWGLLCVHQCGSPRQWQSDEIEFIQHIAEHFGVAVHQSELIHKAQTQSVELSRKVEQERALYQTINKIRQCLEIEKLFQSVTTEIRQLLMADRVAVFQFNPADNWRGEFVAEDVAKGWKSILAERVYDHSCGEQFTGHYQQGDIQAVADIHAADLKDNHAENLSQFQIKANLVIPVLQGEALWGLLCVHQCSATRNWETYEIDFVQRIAEHLGVALKQVETLSQVQYQAEQQRALTGVITRIRESLDLEIIFETTVKEVLRLLKADRVGIFQFYPDNDWEGGFVAEERVDGLSSVVTERVQDHCFGENYSTLYKQGRMYVSDDINTSGLKNCHVQILERFQVKANVVVPLIQEDELWGLLCIHQCFNTRQWQASEIEFIRQIGEQLSVALAQKQQVDQLQKQAAQLAEAASRERALERQKLLSVTVDKIRQSLDLTEIFDTTTHEVRHLLAAERIAIYRFNSDWSGDFVAESMSAGWIPLVGGQPTVEDTHLMETQGGRYANQETFAVDDIYTAGHSDCHIALLEEFQARAYAIAPIMTGDRLWGMLAAYQNSGPRCWQADEVELLGQLGTHLGVAIKQAEALEQVRQQAAALAKATRRQKALSHTIDKIRQSLDINVIFKTTTQEVRQLLEVDRVAIYRFNADWSGAFVADSIVDGWQPALTSETVIEEVFSRPDSNGLYPRNEVFVPISQGDKLWGLLMAYHTSKPRYWDEDEMGLLAQVGSQLGVALQQAELLKQTRQQTNQLNQAFQDLQRTQARLVQGEKMAGLGHLVAGIAHEINNPISFVSGNIPPAQEYVVDLLDMLQLYQTQYPEPTPAIKEKAEAIAINSLMEDLPEILKSMDIGASRIIEIVQSLRVFSRADETACKHVDIHEGIDSTLLILRHRLKEHQPAIEVVKNYGEIPLIDCYAGQINQVFMNLISNAIDAFVEVPDQAVTPQISITTNWNQTSNSIAIKIEDNGAGIPHEIMDSIFNPFFTTKPVGKGTGLGLSISYQVVTEIHHGRLECCSQPGEGTTFRIELPILEY